MRYLILSALLLCACSTPTTSPNPASSTSSSSPNPGNSASPSASPSSSAATTVGASALTATRVSYAAYLTCMNEKHPGKGYASILALINTGVYDQNWAVYKSQADNSVKINSDTYGKECGA